MRNQRMGRNSILALTLSLAMTLTSFSPVYAQEANAENDVVEVLTEESVVSEDDIALQECADDSTNEETTESLDDLTLSEDVTLTEDVILSEEISESEDELCLDNIAEEKTVDDEITDTENEDVEEVYETEESESDEDMELMASKIYSDTLVPAADAEGIDKFKIHFKTSYRSSEPFRYKLYYAKDSFTADQINLQRVTMLKSDRDNIDKSTGEGVINMLTMIQNGIIREGGYFMAYVEMCDHDVNAIGACFKIETKKFSQPKCPKWEGNTATWNPLTDAYEYEVIFRNETKEYDYEPVIVKGDNSYTFNPKGADWDDMFTFTVCASPDYYTGASNYYRVNGYTWSDYSEKSPLQRPHDPLLNVKNIRTGNFNHTYLGANHGDDIEESPDCIYFTAPSSTKKITYTCSLYQTTEGYAPTFIVSGSYTNNPYDKETTVGFNLLEMIKGKSINKNSAYYVEITGKNVDSGNTQAIIPKQSDQFYFIDGITAKLVKNSDGTMMCYWVNPESGKRANTNISFYKWEISNNGIDWVDIDRSGEQKQYMFDPEGRDQIYENTRIYVIAGCDGFIGTVTSNEVQAGATSAALKGTVELTYSNDGDSETSKANPRIGNQASLEATFTPSDDQKDKLGAITYTWYADAEVVKSGKVTGGEYGNRLQLSDPKYAGKNIRCHVTAEKMAGEVLSETVGPVKKTRPSTTVSGADSLSYIEYLSPVTPGSSEYVSSGETVLIKGCGWSNGKVNVAIVKSGEEPTFSDDDVFYAEFVKDVTSYSKECDCLTPGEKYDAWFYKPETEYYEDGYLIITFTVKNHKPEMQPSDPDKVKYYSNCVMHWKHCTECGNSYDYEAHYDLDNNGKCDLCGMTYSDNALYILSSESEIPDAATAKLGDFEYTGKQVCPEVFVYCGGHLLKQGRDYKLKYANNVKVCDFDATAKDKKGNDVEVGPSVTATGAGNYKGSCTARFSIVKADITYVDIADVVAKYANGKDVKISPVVKLGGTTLVAGRDYEFYNTSSGEWVKSYAYSQADGYHTVNIRGINNYKGETSFRFEIIKELKSISNLKIDAIPKQNYTGKEITGLRLYSNKVSLDDVLGAGNYKVTYENNIEPGKAVAVVSINEGKAAAAGYSEMGSKKVSFNIVENNLKNASLRFKNVEYTGNPVSLEYGDVTFKKADGSTIKLSGSDYSAEWK